MSFDFTSYNTKPLGKHILGDFATHSYIFDPHLSFYQVKCFYFVIVDYLYRRKEYFKTTWQTPNFKCHVWHSGCDFHSKPYTASLEHMQHTGLKTCHDSYLVFPRPCPVHSWRLLSGGQTGWSRPPGRSCSLYSWGPVRKEWSDSPRFWPTSPHHSRSNRREKKWGLFSLEARTPEDYDKRSVLSSPESDDLTPARGGEGNAKERKKTRGVKCTLPRPGLQEVYSVSQLCSGSHGIEDLEKSKWERLTLVRRVMYVGCLVRSGV